MIHESTLVEAVKSDTGLTLPGFDRLREFRSEWLNSALLDPNFEVRVPDLIGIEFLSKVRDLARRPESSLPMYLAAQDPAPVSADDVVLDDVARAYNWLAGSFDLEEIACSMRHGPGAVTDGLVSYDKWLTPLNIGPMADYADPLNRMPRTFVNDVNRFTEVPKTSWTLRGICIENAANQLEQQGIGTTLRRRLRSRGFDLSNQWRQNITYAKRGSSVTLDLSAASDKISVQLMRLICANKDSLRWFDVMDSARSRWSSLPDNELVKVNTFASMGNGFCFVNLTMVCMACVFAAIRAARPHLRSLPLRATWDIYRNTTSVFGDDIVTDQWLRDDLCFVLESVGLKINYAKSSFGGNLKETCGAYVIDKGGENHSFVYAIPRLKYINPVPNDHESLVSFCNTQRALWRRGYVDMAEALASYVFDGPLSRYVNPVWEAPFSETSASLFSKGTTDQFGNSLVMHTSLRLSSGRGWHRRRQRAFTPCMTPTNQTRPVSLGDSVGFAATLFGDRVTRLSDSENCGSRTRLITKSVFYRPQYTHTIDDIRRKFEWTSGMPQPHAW